MKFWLIIISIIVASSVAVSSLAFLGLPYEPLSSLNHVDDPYGPPPMSGLPDVEQYLVTLRGCPAQPQCGVEVNKASTGGGSPWVQVVEDQVTFDLLDVAGSAQFLGETIAETGTYRIIRMYVEKVELKIAGIDGLIPVRPTPPMIQ